MSLLMQALKKAERAKQNALPDEELDKPSEAFDEILALTPEPAPPTYAAAPMEFSLEPMDGLSLEPLAPPVADSTATEPRPSPSPLPASSDHKQPGLTKDLALDPIAAPPAVTPTVASAAAGAAAGNRQDALSTPAAAQAAAIGAATATAALSTHAPSASRPSPSALNAPASASPAAATATTAKAAATAAASAPHATTSAERTAAGATASAGSKGGSGASAAKPRAGGSGRARTRTATTAEPSSFDPERLRLFGLIGLLVLLVGGFGIYYWIALTGPGAGAGLPPVPMPPQNATAGSSGPGGAGQIIAANNGPAAPAGTATEADADDPMLAPTAGNRGNTQDLERRLERTEQELAAAQQAIQAAAAAPRTEQLPVLTAPKNDDIRITRLVQPAPVSPALDSAYQAFNSGDTAGAQQQYDAALAQDANNRDALLGAAHVAARQNLKDKAAGYYLRLLELSPNDVDATAGLIGLRQGDISQSEARLKAILANTPDAGPVLFTLGNLYAQQGRWPDAQQAYFRAVGAAPDNPDYAYNLAIGLDRLNQSKLALGYYQRALALAQDKAVGFDRSALRKRMHELSTITH